MDMFLDPPRDGEGDRPAKPDGGGGPERTSWVPAFVGTSWRAPRARQDGFTLIELMVVLVIIGLLATIVIINVLPAADRAAVTKAHADIATLEQGIEMYRLDNQRYPTSQEGLQVLVAGHYIPRLPEDPWHHPYLYAAPGEGGKPFRVATLGADGHEGGSGNDADISN